METATEQPLAERDPNLPLEWPMEWPDGAPYLVEAPCPGIRRMVCYPGVERLSQESGSLAKQIWLLLESAAGRVHLLRLPRGDSPLHLQLQALGDVLARWDLASVPLDKALPHVRYLTGVELTVFDGYALPPELPLALVDAHATEVATAWHLSLTGGEITNALPGRIVAMKWQMWAGLKSSLRAFMAHLDPDILALEALWPDGVNTARYNWVLGLGAQSRSRRLKACHVMPRLIPVLSGERGPPGPVERALCRAVDEDEPLDQALAQAGGLASAAVAQCVLNRLVSGQDTLSPYRLRYLLAALEGLSCPALPQDNAHWQGLETLVFRTLPAITGLPPNSAFNRGILQKLLTGSRGSMAKNVADLGLGDDAAKALRAFLAARRSTLDHALEAILCLEKGEAGGLTHSVLDWVLAEAGLANVLVCVDEWLAYKRCLISGRVSTATAWSEIVWPSVLDDRFDLASCHIVPLRSSEVLYEEARLMANCLRKYLVPCLIGTSHLFSIRRNGDGKPIADLELDFQPGTDGGYQVSIRQLEGPGNNKPSRKAQLAALKLREYLRGAVGQRRIAATLAQFEKLNALPGQAKSRVAQDKRDGSPDWAFMNDLPVPELCTSRLISRALAQLGTYDFPPMPPERRPQTP